jgi:hypothetical protein
MHPEDILVFSTVIVVTPAFQRLCHVLDTKRNDASANGIIAAHAAIYHSGPKTRTTTLFHHTTATTGGGADGDDGRNNHNNNPIIIMVQNEQQFPWQHRSKMWNDSKRHVAEVVWLAYIFRFAIHKIYRYERT